MRSVRFVLIGLALFVSSALMAHADMRRKVRRHVAPDTMLVLHRDNSDMPLTNKMSTSAYPVQMAVQGRAIRIQSDRNQILPVYTQSGAFYMAMRLQKGTNWLNGLPRGRYFINNRPIAIN